LSQKEAQWTKIGPFSEETRLTNEQWVTVMRQRLEVECIPDGTHCDCAGNPVIDATGRYLWKCPKAIGAHMVAPKENSNLYSIFKNAAGKSTKTKFPPPFGGIMKMRT
jgi:hypothetical protein